MQYIRLLGASVGTTPSGGQGVLSPSCHKHPPVAQQQYEHRASGGPAEHLEWDSVQVAVPQTTHRTNQCDPLSTMASRVMFGDVMIISPVLHVLHKETPSP